MGMGYLVYVHVRDKDHENFDPTKYPADITYTIGTPKPKIIPEFLVVTSPEDLLEKEEYLIGVANEWGGRIYLGYRPILLNDVDRESFESLYIACKYADGLYYSLVDIDYKCTKKRLDRYRAVISRALEPTGGKIWYTIDTPNGHHIVTDPFFTLSFYKVSGKYPRKQNHVIRNCPELIYYNNNE